MSSSALAPTRRPRLAVLMGTITAFAYSCMSASGRWALQLGATPSIVVLMRSIFCMLVAAFDVCFVMDPNIRRTAIRNACTRYASGLIILRATCAFMSLVVYFYAAQTSMALGDMAALMQTSPVFCMMLGYAFLGERATQMQYLVAGLALPGCILIIRPDFLFGADTSAAAPSTDVQLGIAATVASTVLMAGAFVTIQTLNRRTNVARPVQILYNMIFCTVAALALSIASESADAHQKERLANPWRFDEPMWCLALLAVAVSGTIAQYGMVISIGLDSATTFSITQVFEVLCNFLLWDTVVFRVPLRLLSLVGAVLICTGVVLLAAFPGARPSRVLVRSWMHGRGGMLHPNKLASQDAAAKGVQEIERSFEMHTSTASPPPSPPVSVHGLAGLI